MINNIKGVGPKTDELLSKLGIMDIEDLINYYPFRYQIYNETELIDNTNIIIEGIIESNPKTFFIKKNFNKTSFRVYYHDLLINVVIYNRAFIKNNLKVGNTITILGKYEKNKNIITANDIKLNSISKLGIEPIYHLVSGLTSKKINQFIIEALKTFFVEDNIPFQYHYNFIDKKDALSYIHHPNSLDDIKKAKVRLIYEELFTFMFKINYLKIKRKVANEVLIKAYDENKYKEYISSLPFVMTNDQEKVTNEILNEFKSKSVVNRLILGDVGSGKTLVAVNSIYANYLSGYQSILMAPTEILAFQHYESICKLLKNTDVKICLLTGSTKKKEKDKIYQDIENNKIDLLIGTHSVLNDNIIFNNLGLVITDEQHRFGVKQRNILRAKNSSCDVIYLSATPIPRTYALTLYGDMDVSMIKTKPSGRKDIITKVFSYKELKEVLIKMLEEIKNNHQVFVVCPLIESETSDLTNVTDLKEKMNMAFNNKIPIEILHGKLKNKDKDAIMERFKNNETKILISTTVIEVGIDIKNATMMVIFDANRFGLATLHQLRGRVGRNELTSYCYLISNTETERLKVMEESNDGFYISEKDFEIRGSGDLFGTMQSGDMSFKLANLITDYKILLQASKDSEEYLLNSDYLNNDYYNKIINELNNTD